MNSEPLNQVLWDLSSNQSVYFKAIPLDRARRLRELEFENNRLKKPVLDQAESFLAD